MTTGAMVDTTFPDGSTPRIAIIGAGFGGLTVAIQLKRLLGLSTFTIFEKNADVGGAWFVNTYPGAATDVSGVFYSWSFEPNPEWTAVFPGQEEILEYIRRTARKYCLYDNIQFHTTVDSAIWENEIGKWKVTTSRAKELTVVDYFDFVVTAISMLWNPQIPESFESFRGPKMHTARWQKDIDLRDKVVGVVGSGSSGVQVIPAILHEVKELHAFQRNPAWICPKFFNFKNLNISRFLARNVPFFQKFFRWSFFWAYEIAYEGSVHKSLLNRIMKIAGKGLIRVETRKKRNAAKLVTPKYVAQCKHTPLSNDYLPALASQKTALHIGSISKVTEDGIVTEKGDHVKVDVLILATGFKFQDFFAPLKIFGDQGDILGNWKNDRPRAFYGIATSEAKNLFFVCGAYGLPGATSAIFVMECQARYIVNLLRKMMTRNLHQFRLTEAAEEKFMNFVDRTAKRTVWAHGDCNGIYSNDKNQVTIYPGRATSFWRGTRKVKMDKFNFFDTNSKPIIVKSRAQ